MRPASFACVALLVLLAACETPAQGPAAAAEPAHSAQPAQTVSAHISDLAWLTGVWTVERDGRRAEEYWTSPAGGQMLGAGRVTKQGKLESFEHLRIEERGNTLVYVALPFGKGATDFTLTKLGSKAALFENPAHDFPQRILYRMDGEELVTHVDGRGGSPEEWRFTRAN